jgi:hypothetical protein
MTYVDRSDRSTTNDETSWNDKTPWKVSPQSIFGSLALGAIVLACGWTLCVNLSGTNPDAAVFAPTVTIVTAKPAVSATAATTVIVKQPAASVQPAIFVAPTLNIGAVFDTKLLGRAALTFSQSAPLNAALESGPAVRRVTRSIPIPAPRPAELAQLHKPSPQAKPQRGTFALASAASAPFEKMFGKPESAGPALAYAAPDGGVFGDGQSKSAGRIPANPDGFTAIYDITARTVYMPDGTRLEAHSGLRGKLDDPRYVHMKMHGATPPHTYDLVPREALFHGVQAIRLIPVGGEGAIFGRTGLLAHTYMLGPNGDSNGCVSFKDYHAFLRAFQNGKVKRLVVVERGGLTALAANN